MFTTWLRKLFKGLIDPAAALMARLGIGANALTIIGCLMNIGVAAVIATGHLQLGGALLIVASGFDALDGTLARQTGRPTRFGAFLDSVLDRVSESAILLGLAIWYMTQPGITGEILAYVAVVGSLLVSYTRARAEGLQIECEVGLFTRVERCIILIVALLLNLTLPALWLLAVGTMLTTLHRIVFTYSKIKDQPL
jgi:CDP-diacylglycerol--glycerol-3-phosphate 3-phosphatidyltransferase